MNYDCQLADGVKVRVVRAFLTSEDVRKNHGIYADFSIKLIGQVSVKGAKPEEIELASLNGLTLSSTRDGKPFIGSIGKDDGRGGRIYAAQFFPIGFVDVNAGQTKEQKQQEERQKDFITRLTKTVTEAANGFAKRQIEQRAVPVPTPSAYNGMPARKTKVDQDVTF